MEKRFNIWEDLEKLPNSCGANGCQTAGEPLPQGSGQDRVGESNAGEELGNYNVFIQVIFGQV